MVGVGVVVAGGSRYLLQVKIVSLMRLIIHLVLSRNDSFASQGVYDLARSRDSLTSLLAHLALRPKSQSNYEFIRCGHHCCCCGCLWTILRWQMVRIRICFIIPTIVGPGCPVLELFADSYYPI